MSTTKSPLPPTAKKATPVTRRRFLRPLIVVVLIAAVLIGWQLINNSINSTNPSSAGRPLSNPHTHLHTVALGGRPGVLYLGTYFGMFTSTDGGHTWPQPHGVLDTMMITVIAVNPANTDVMVVMAIPVSGEGVQSGIYLSNHAGATAHAGAPVGLPASAGPSTLKTGTG